MHFIQIAEGIIPIFGISDLRFHQEYNLLKQPEEAFAQILGVGIVAIGRPRIVETEQVDDEGQHIVEHLTVVLTIGKCRELIFKRLVLGLNSDLSHDAPPFRAN